MATGSITDKINNVVALLIDQCYCETPSEISVVTDQIAIRKKRASLGQDGNGRRV
jgi:hypothetical protein